MNVFDILGPVMIGPSSSHTAGAARIGLMTRALLGKTPVKAHIFLHGSFAKTYKGHGTDKALVAGPVAYIGDCDKDIALLQKASVAISRGGVHNENVTKNSDIMLTDSNFDTIIDLLKIARKQKAVNIQNTFIGILITLLVVLLGVLGLMPWWVACIIYILESVLVLFNSQLIIRM